LGGGAREALAQPASAPSLPLLLLLLLLLLADHAALTAAPTILGRAIPRTRGRKQERERMREESCAGKTEDGNGGRCWPVLS